MIKKTFILLLFAFFTTSVFAQYGTLTVSSNTNQKFWLFIDDVLQNEYSTHAIKIQGLQFIPYRVRVEMDNRENNCVGRTLLISNRSNQNNYVVSADRMNNYTFGPAKTVPNPFFIQNIIVPDFSYYNDYQQYLYPGFNPNVSYGQNQYKGSKYKGYQYNYQGGGYGQGNNPGHGNPGHGNPGHGNPGYDNPGHGQGKCMHDPDFSKALSVIRGESFDDSKLSTAKQIASNNYLCVSQIVQICRLLSFEQSKLDFAKYAYRSCVDPKNYFQLNDVFSFAASKDELRKFIGN